MCGRLDANANGRTGGGEGGGGDRAPPGAGSAGINQTENYTHSSAELAKEKYICHIALKPGEVAAEGAGEVGVLVGVAEFGVSPRPGKWRKIWVTVRNLMAYKNQ